MEPNEDSNTTEDKRLYGQLPRIKTTSGEEISALPIYIQNPPKTACLRLPTNAELMTYLGSQRSHYRDLGNRKGKTEEVANTKADRALFMAVRLDKSGAEFDDAEMSYALGILTRHRVMGCVRDGDKYVIAISTILGDTTHTVRIPYQKEMAAYQRNVYTSIDMPHGLEERRFPPEVPVQLYDAVFVGADGYLEADADVLTLIPPHHKRAVVMELISSLSALDPSFSPN